MHVLAHLCIFKLVDGIVCVFNYLFCKLSWVFFSEGLNKNNLVTKKEMNVSS